jgi:L-alanine-DL-glutamate epimerase-like enolase superfamily enzyme
MKIARIQARTLRPLVRVHGPGFDRQERRELNVVEIETADGLKGHGITTLTDARSVVALVNGTIADALRGTDPRTITPLWSAIYTQLCQRGHTGIAFHGLSAVDIALWDLRGKALGEPVWRLLGGSRKSVPCYVTCGLPNFSPDELGEVAKYWVNQGFGGVKLVVGLAARYHASSFTNLGQALRDDVARVRAVREAVGDGIEIAVDINCELDDASALALARLLAPYDIAFIEEPIQDNDPARTAAFRRASPIAVATGQSIGSLSKFGALLANDAVDVLQPNVVNCGGYTGGLRAAAVAQAFGKLVTNGGGSTAHNAHLIAAVTNGGSCEWHPYMSAGATAAVFRDTPVPVDGVMHLSDRPGLGFVLDEDAAQEFS